VATLRDRPVRRDPAAVGFRRVGHSDQPLAAVLLAEQLSCLRAIGQAAAKELALRNNLPAAPSRLETKSAPGRPGNLRSVRQKAARVIFLVPLRVLALAPPSAAD